MRKEPLIARLSTTALLAGLACGAALPAMAQDPAPLPQKETDFRPLPLQEAARIVTDRYEGRLIAARLTGPHPHERRLGAQLVEEIRLLTPHGNLLNIRLDARTGRFLEIAGTGQIEALK